jgi:hypothetical protein
MNKNLLLSLGEVAQKQYSTPYIYEIKNHGKTLFYFGARHTRDPKDPQFETLEKSLTNFISDCSKEKTIILIEGQTSKILLETFSENVEKFGESGAIAFWARQNGVPYFRPEPPLDHEITELLKDYTKEEIYYYYIARVIAQWHRLSIKEEISKYITPYIERYQKTLTWENFDFSLNNIKNIHQKIFGKEFDLNDANFFKIISNPTGTSTTINKVAASCSTIRNYYILDKINDYWQKGLNIFIVYGSGHAVAQEPVIKSLVSY